MAPTLPNTNKAEDFMRFMVMKTEKENYQLCLTGSAFNELIGNHMDDIS